MNAIEAKGLSRMFGRSEALHGLDLQVPEGSVFALLGSNGAGKTTIKLLTNRIFPTSGSATVLGVSSLDLGPGQFRRIGYVSGSQVLPLWLTVRQFLDYCRPFYPKWDPALEKELLKRFDLPADRKLGVLSRGMRMKAALVSALAFRPSLLFLDEPLSGLDPMVRDEFTRGLLSASSDEGRTILISSHDIDDIERMVDHVAVLDSGKLRLSESLESLSGRFRKVEASRISASHGAPDGASDWESSGDLARFVVSGYVAGRSEEAWRERFPGAEIATQPMSLREIVLTSIRSARSDAKGIL